MVVWTTLFFHLRLRRIKRIRDLAKRKQSQTNRARQARAFALTAAKIAAERHCTDIVVLDLRGISPATDYFVITTGTSDRQMRTVADEIYQAAKVEGLGLFGRAGYVQARWILLDFIDIVVHIFDQPYREYYDLELLWGDAKKIYY